MKGIDRFWLLTWTCYGQWLPGDPRGSVTRLEAQGQSHRQELDEFGTPYVEPIAGLYESAQKSLKGDPVRLCLEHAESLLEQFQETSTFRSWCLAAVAIMANHVHVVLRVPGDPEPETVLRDLKSWGSRKLNRNWTRPKSVHGGLNRAPNENSRILRRSGTRFSTSAIRNTHS